MGRRVSKIPTIGWPLIFGLVLGVVSYSTSSVAEDGTAEERAACTPYVFKLCAFAIPSTTRIVACLKEKKAELSPECRAAISKPSSPRGQ
jgi:hypothetical protein